MPSIQELHAQRAELEKQIAEATAQAREEGLALVHKLMTDYSLTPQDIIEAVTPRRAGAQKGTKVAPKYRDPLSGETWSGRGIKPKWLAAQLDAGRQLADFAV